MSGFQIVKPKVQVARTAVTCVAIAASAYVETRAIGRKHDSHVSHQSLRGWYTMFPTLCTEPRCPSQAQSASAFHCRSCVSPLHPSSYLQYVTSHPFPPSAMSGQYLLAPLCGEWIDRYGPWATSLSASVLFASGWGWFAFEIHGTTFVGPESPAWPFRRLVVASFLCGLATASSYVTRWRARHNATNIP